ncbi:MAG: sialate O-acetylesterase [Verrucomicrobiales bacterium]|nr:sialate O-acetylesterase [Verrucomicrobiales bacterium]
MPDRFARLALAGNLRKNHGMRFSAFLLTLLGAFAFTGSAQEKTERHLILLIGQSNMAGRAKLEAEDKKPIKGAFLWHIGEKKWGPALAPFNLHSPSRKEVSMQRLNCGPSFVRAYLEANPGVEVGVVCAARGGSSVEQWKKKGKDKFQLYKHAIEAAKAAKANGGEFKAILWHQGESNSGDISDYAKKLTELIENLRSDLEQPEVPFVYSQLGQWRPEYGDFNKLIVTLPEKIPHTACVTTEDLTAMDKAHFDTKSQRELGRRYFSTLQPLLKK